MIDYLVLLVLCVWGVATIFYQFHATADWVGKWNYFSLIPKWTFFAPRPKTTDYHLCYQDRRVGAGTMSEPVRIEMKPVSRWVAALRFIWNPHKRNTKAVVDITNFIVAYKARHRRRIARNSLALEMYVPYLSLLNFVSSYAPPAARDARRRFVVLKTSGYGSSDPAVPVLESNFHRVES
jgi:hypothetical protein